MSPNISKQPPSRPPPGYITEQACHSATFVHPPLDGSMYVPEMVDWHLKWSAQHSFTILAGDSPEGNINLSWSEVGHAVHRLGGKFLQAVYEGAAAASGRPKTVAILANVDSLTYCTILLALLRAGFEPFPLSSRNSVPALLHLLQSTHASHIVGSILPGPEKEPSALELTTQAVLDALPGLKLLSVPKCSEVFARLSIWPVPSYDATIDARSTTLLPPVRSLPSYEHADAKWPGIIVHSSGSTKFPKPIRIHHKALLTWITQFWYGDVDVCDTLWGAMGLPMFHIVGLWIALGSPMGCGNVSVLYKPCDPPTVPTAQNTLVATEVTQAKHLITVPSFCEVWSEDIDAVRFLAKLHGLFYGGGPLPQIAGDRLVRAGVNLVVGYGTTETAMILNVFPRRILPGPDWIYGTISPQVEVEFVHESGDNFRCIVKESEYRTLSVSNIEGEQAFDTNDLLQQHPTEKGFWKVVGRADDQIMMSNGEKTNPGPLEAIITCNPSVRSAIMFGREQAQVGVLIEPGKDINLETEDEAHTFLDGVWPDIEKANAFAPTHSRIFKDLVIVVNPREKPFARTAKGTVARYAVLQQFATEIEAVYRAAEQPSQACCLKPPCNWEEADIRQYVAQGINAIVRQGLKEEGTMREERDIFEQGCDSLQTIYIRHVIVQAVNEAQRWSETPFITNTIPIDLVYTHPTIRSLADFTVNHVRGTSTVDGHCVSKESRQAAEMLNMVNKFSQGLFSSGRCDYAAGEVVLLTGSTGTLGTYLLQALLQDRKVERVFAMNRPSHSKTLLERQTQAFEDRGVDVRLAKSPKLHFIEGEIAEADFALDPTILQELRSSVTAVIHNAWRLDFNLTLQSFEPHVRATHNLINLALSSQRAILPQFIFTSSVGTMSNWDGDTNVPEVALADPHVALKNGYSASKWVAEQLLEAASKDTRFRSTIWRIGQLSGSRTNGAWNVTDWVPVIVRAGPMMQSLPAMDGALVSWLPTDEAAYTIVEGLHKPAMQSPRYLHLVHPRPVEWNVLFQQISSALSIPLIPYDEWLSRLQAKSLADPGEVERNPAIRLLQFFQGGLRTFNNPKDDGSCKREAMGIPRVETLKAEAVSETLAGLTSLSGNDVSKWLEYWRKHAVWE